MMMMADNVSGTFGTIPNQPRPLINVPRQQTVGFDVTKVPILALGNGGGMQMPVTQLAKNELPAAFGGTGGGNTMLAAQIQTSVAPRQTAFGATPTQYKFGANTTAESYVAEKGSANVARDSALASGGASGDLVTKAGAIYTG
jgi:hypothetical protein